MDKVKEIVELTHKLLNASVLHERKKRDLGVGFPLHASELRFIGTVSQYPESNITELAEHLAITKSAVSKMATSLQKKGLVLKYKTADNHKDVLIQLTSIGEVVHRRFQSTYEGSVQFVAGRLENYSDDQKDLIIRFLNGFIDVLTNKY